MFSLMASLSMPLPLSAEEATKEQDKTQTQEKLQTQDKLQTQEQVREQDRLQSQDKLQAKEQLRLKDGKDAEKLTGGGETAVKEQERARFMKGAENAQGEAVREKAENSGAEKALKNQEKNGAGEEKAVKAQERKQEKKRLRNKEHLSGERGSRQEGRGQNRGGAGRRR